MDWTWLKRLMGADDPVQPQATAGISAQPLVINPGDAQKIAHAEYRLDAIKRHIAQREADGRAIHPQRMSEFRHEAREHALLLVKHGRISEDEHDAIVRRLGARV